MGRQTLSTAMHRCMHLLRHSQQQEAVHQGVGRLDPPSLALSQPLSTSCSSSCKSQLRPHPSRCRRRSSSSSRLSRWM